MCAVCPPCRPPIGNAGLGQHEVTLRPAAPAQAAAGGGPGVPGFSLSELQPLNNRAAYSQGGVQSYGGESTMEFYGERLSESFINAVF